MKCRSPQRNGDTAIVLFAIFYTELKHCAEDVITDNAHLHILEY
jgi:hypothetical protein